MPTIYTQNLNGNGGVLRKRIAGYEQVTDPLSCRDELSLQQSVLQDNVEDYAEALETGNKGAKLAFGGMVNDRSKDVINTKMMMARIDQMRSQTISRETLFVWVRSIVARLYEVFPDFPEEVTSLADEIETSILGTSTSEVKESELFAEMFNTVPAIDCDSQEINDMKVET